MSVTEARQEQPKSLDLCSTPSPKVLRNTPGKSPFTPTPLGSVDKRRRGRPSRAENFGNNIKNLQKLGKAPCITSWARGSKRAADPLLFFGSVEKKRSITMPSPNKDVQGGFLFTVGQGGTGPFHFAGSSAANPTNGNVQDPVLAAVNRMEAKLNNITDDLGNVKAGTTELKSLYNNLQKQLQDNEDKREKQVKHIKERLNELEKLCKEQSLNCIDEESRAEIRKQIESQVTVALQDNQGNLLPQLENRLAEKINRSLDLLDANERANKRLNLVVRGLTADLAQNVESLNAFLKSKFKLTDEIKNVELMVGSGRAIVTVGSWETKINVLKEKKAALAGTSIYIDSDLTQREQRIAATLRRLAKEKTEAGCIVKIGRRRLQVNGHWFFWDDFRNCLQPEAQRPAERRAPGKGPGKTSSTGAVPLTSLFGTPTVQAD